ncbi:MAG TPA: hypothetical protein VJ850_04135 [Candidatus Limnocylindrales bacterium]|nr:hypothetical protein [Candidatus Limnocylindrales bacterium]
MKRITRLARVGLAAGALTLAVAAPAAAATPPAAVPTPYRIVHTGLTGFVIPAGMACSFDVAGDPDWGFSAHTYFPNGLVRSSVRAHGAYVNVETGVRYPTADNFYVVDDVDPVTNIDHVFLSGMAASSFLPGDDGPFGLVTEASFYDFVGTITFDYNLNTGQQTNFSYHGTVTDICAALS